MRADGRRSEDLTLMKRIRSTSTSSGIVAMNSPCAAGSLFQLLTARVSRAWRESQKEGADHDIPFDLSSVLHRPSKLHPLQQRISIRVSLLFYSWGAARSVNIAPLAEGQF